MKRQTSNASENAHPIPVRKPIEFKFDKVPPRGRPQNKNEIQIEDEEYNFNLNDNQKKKLNEK